MYFRIIEDSRCSALGYLLADLGRQAAVAIDPPPGQEALICALLDECGLRLQHVARTHVHRPDHAGCADLCSLTGAGCVAGAKAGLAAAARQLVHGDALLFGDEVLHVLATPGHTPGCISFRWRDRLFCGDVFDVDGCAVDGSESDPALLYDSLTQRIFTLPDETLVFPSHRIKGRAVSTVADERRRHARVMGGSREGFLTEMASRRLVRSRSIQTLDAAGSERGADKIMFER